MVLQAEHIRRDFTRKRGDSNVFAALAETDLELCPGAVTVVTGHSGSGKSTLLHICAGLLRPTAGRVLLDGTDLYALEDKELSRLRNRHMGLIPQGQSALGSLTVLENILLPCSIGGRGAGGPGDRVLSDAEELMERFGIAELRDVLPLELSGGELRRMAIARALILRPEIILADEPTGDLDSANTKIVLETLRERARAGAAVLLITHERDAESFADALYAMENGVLTAKGGDDTNQGLFQSKLSVI